MAASPSTPVELYTREEGEGSTILLVHGLGGDHAVWNAVLPLLSPRFHVLAPDLRGHGRSPAPPGSTYGFEELDADILGFLDRHQLSHAHVVGMSAGGFLSLYTAVHHRERLQSLVVVSAAAHCDAHTRSIGINWAEVYRNEGYEAYFLRLLKDLYYPDWIEAHLDFADHLREQLRHQRLEGALKWGQAIGRFDVRPQLSKLTVPTLAVQGMDDRVVDPSHGRLLRQAIPGAELRLLPSTGHMVPVERPRELAEAISTWVLRSNTANGSGGSKS